MHRHVLFISQGLFLKTTNGNREEMMPSSKYDHLKIFKETVAEEIHICDGCGESILIGSAYYMEKLTNSRIGFLGKRLCVKCHMK
jgi:hypothetical protein